MKKLLFVIISLIILLAFLISLIFVTEKFQKDYQAKQQQDESQQQVFRAPILEKSGKTLPEILKLDSVDDLYDISTGQRKDYIYCSNEPETRIAESALREVIRNSDFIVLHRRKTYTAGEWDRFIVDDQKFLTLLSDNFTLESDCLVYEPGGTNRLMSRFIQFQPSGLNMRPARDLDSFDIWDSCDPTQIGILRKVSDEFILLNEYYFSDFNRNYFNIDSDKPRYLDILVTEIENGPEILARFQSEIQPFSSEKKTNQ